MRDIIFAILFSAVRCAEISASAGHNMHTMNVGATAVHNALCLVNRDTLVPTYCMDVRVNIFFKFNLLNNSGRHKIYSLASYPNYF